MSVCYRVCMKLFQDHYRQRILSTLGNQKLFLLDKMLDLVNLAAAALIFGQLIQTNPIDQISLVIGIALVIVAYGWVWYTLNTFR